MSNNLKRVLAGLLGIPLIIAACYFRGEIFVIFSLIVSSFALWEFFNMFKKKNINVLTLGVLILSAVMIVLNQNSQALIYTFLTGTTLLLTIEIFRKEIRNPFNTAISIFGIIYISVPFIILNLLVNIPGFNFVIYLFVLIWTCDTFAYYGGKILGKTKLSGISPGKTVEGSVSGFIFTVIISITVHFFYSNELSLFNSIMLGILVGIFSQVGDLFESLIKRFCEVKDSSEIIPGHGGVLDRFDSIIFTAPVVYVYCKLIIY